MDEIKEVEREKKERKIDAKLIIFFIIFIPILIIVLTIVIKATLYPDKIPDVFGYKPFIVLDDTITEIKKEDLILTKMVDESKIEVGDIISYKDHEVVVTHEVIGIQKESGKTYFVVNISDNSSIENNVKIDSEIVEGKYLFRIASLRRNTRRDAKLFHYHCTHLRCGCNSIYVISRKNKKRGQR